MKEIQTDQITKAVADLCIRTNVELGEDVMIRLRDCLGEESSPTGKEVLKQIIRNAEFASAESMPMCQDTGLIVVFIELGQDIHITGGDLRQAVQEGVRRGTREGFLRNSVVRDAFDRKNTGDNTPAVIHLELIPGDILKLTVAPKGGGSENMSTVRMLNPSVGLEGVRRFVTGWVEQAGANPCPPVIVGVGIGGNFERCAFLAKKSLMRRIGQRNPNPVYSKLETGLLNEINRLGIGPQGFGGRCTALDVFVETEPCHIASLPVGVNLQCHAARHGSVLL